ncbi:hypothetical protein [Massilibacterium senegalense]|uniref:hypothetical protein n=1 Tax=Massilibacterium senegalense TaxID=1632858 RepID=UPI001E395E63|nr:hypothetical protein [Massilibacterium senegalense]
MGNKSKLAYMLIFFSLIMAVYLIMNSTFLMPKGYELAIDGFVLSRTLLIIFVLYVVVKLGFYLLNKKD